MTNATTYIKGIRGLILRGRHHGPNGGLSAVWDEVTIVGDDVPQIQSVRDDAPAVEIYETVPGYVALRPIPGPDGRQRRYMASGAYVAPDGGSYSEFTSLFGSPRPVPLHDCSE